MAAKRIGRPTKEPKPGERVSLGLRVTAEIKRQLDVAARKSGRSQSQEAELRIERTFVDDFVTRSGVGPIMGAAGGHFITAAIKTAQRLGYNEDRLLENLVVDATCYQSGMTDAIDYIIKRHPAYKEDDPLGNQELYAELMKELANRVGLVVQFRGDTSRRVRLRQHLLTQLEVVEERANLLRKQLEVLEQKASEGSGDDG